MYSFWLGILIVMAPGAQEPLALPDVPQQYVSPYADFHGDIVRAVVREEVLSGSAASTQGEALRETLLELEDRQIVRQVIFGGSLPDHETRFLYRDNALVEVIRYSSSGVVEWRHQYVYENRLLVREVVSGAGENVESTVTYQYENGEITAITQFGAGNQQQWRRVFAREPSGMSWQLYAGDGRWLNRVEVAVNRDGIITAERRWDQPDAAPFETVYRHDDRGHRVGWVIRAPDGSRTQEGSVAHDEMGNVVRHEVRDLEAGQRTITLSEYRYDEQDNWVYLRERTVVERDGERTLSRAKVTERELHYEATR
jgi:hypothetical protein